MDVVNYAELYLRVAPKPSDILLDTIRIYSDRVSPSGIVIDAGCGPGLYIPFLVDMLGPKGKLVAVDMLMDMIIAAKTRASALPNPSRIKVKLGKIENLEGTIPAHSVDLIFCASVLHFTDLSCATTSFSKIIREGGLLIFSIPLGIANLLDEKAGGFYGVFREELREEMIRQILRESATYSTAQVMQKRPQRNFRTYLKAVKKVGFDIVQIYSAPELVSASVFADHLSVPWRTQKLLPGMSHEAAERYLRCAVKATMERLKVPDNYPFSRDIYYAVARRRTH